MRSRSFVVSFAVGALLAAGVVQRTFAAQPSIWLEDIKAPLELQERDGEALLKYAQARFANPDAKIALTGNAAADVGAAVVNDTQPRVVLLSYTSGDKAAVTRTGSGVGIVSAIDVAVRSGPPVPAEQLKWLKLDIVRSARPVLSRWKGDTLGIQSGEGVALPRPSTLAVSWERLQAEALVSDQLRFDPHHLPGAAPSTEESRSVLFFTCDSFYTDGVRTRAVRHDDWLAKGSSTRQDFDLAIALAGDYLTRSVQADGKFVYQYSATADAEDAEYNIVRHAGAILSLAYHYEATGRRDVVARDAMVRSIQYLLAAAKPAPGLKDADTIVEADRAKLGGTGLGLNAVAYYTKYTGDKQFLPAMKRLGNWLVQTQGERGNFRIHEQRFSDGVVLATSSLYAPGEAIWGLATLHDLDPEGPWLEAAGRATDFLVTTRDPSVTAEMKLQDHWLQYAMENVSARSKTWSWDAHARKMAATIMGTQIESSVEHPGWAGAYTRPPNANQTATRVEGLCAAYRTLKSARDGQWRDRIRNSVEAGTRFQLRQQFLVPEAMYYPNPAAILGGFRNSPADPRVRIDTVQHNILALIDARPIIFDIKP